MTGMIVMAFLSAGSEGETHQTDRGATSGYGDSQGTYARQLEISLMMLYLSLQTLLDEAAKKESHEVCVAPKYLVPDTNCFVDMLPSIRTLVKSGLFTVTIPLTGTCLS